jgi:hypothetical protein
MNKIRVSRVIDMKYTFKKVISFAVILCFVFQPTFVFANSAPSFQPEPNGTIIPIEDIPIEVKEEKIQFVLHEDDKPAEVVAQYVFMNPTENPIETYLALPYTSVSDLSIPEIKVNDASILKSSIKIYSKKNQPSKYLDKFKSTTFIYIDPITGEIRDSWNGYDVIKHSDASVFKVSFAPLKETTIKIEYPHNFVIDKTNYINPVYLYNYLIQPAVSWKEFRNLQISMAVPRNQYFESNLTLKPYHGALTDWFVLPKEVQKNPSHWVYFKGNYTSLPKKNFAFSTISKDELLFGMVDKKDYDLIGLMFLGVMATLSIYGTALLINRIQKWWMHWQVGPVLAFIVSNTLTFLSYRIFIHFFPVAVNGEWIGGSSSIFTILFFGFYNTIIYFPLMMVIEIAKRRRRKQLEGEIVV